jgi:hypothetical protein
MIKLLTRLRNKVPIYFGLNCVIHSIDVGYPGIYLWLGKLAISLGGYDDPDIQWYKNTEPNYPYGIYIKLGNFEWSNWNLDSEPLP